MVQILLRFIKNPRNFFRYSVYPKITRRLPSLNYIRKTTDPEKEFIKKIGRYKINWQSENKNIVLLQMVEDYAFGIRLIATANHLAKKHNANIGLYSVETRIEKPNYPTSSVWRFLSSLFSLELLDKIYLAVGGKIIYKNTDVYHDQNTINNSFLKIKQGISTKHDVLKINIEGIKIGDLVYDTYLRFAEKSSVDINDPFFDKVLIQALNIYYVSKEKLESNHIVALVNSYTTYTKHGIIVRIALSKNIPVYTPICGYISLVHRVSDVYPSHLNNHFSYKQLFETLENKDLIIEKHKEIFEQRFKGVVDGATYYMKESAFSSATNPELNDVDWPNTIVVLAHCFFDSPHVYRDLIFTDLYDWMILTLDELAKQKKLTILVKQHPNGLIGNEAIFEKLKIKYKDTNIQFIDKKTSQLQIINSRPKAIVTAHGTAAAEFSYQNFPVLAVYDNPFTAYDFTHLAKTVEQYIELLGNISNLESKQNKNEIIEYFYMHNSFFLKGRESDYLSLVKYKSDTFSDNFLKDYLPKMDEAYFKMLDSSIKDGVELTEWETEICKNK